MDKTEFEKRLSSCGGKKDLAVLAENVLEDLCFDEDVAAAKTYVEQLLDKGLDPSVCSEDDEFEPCCINDLAYVYNEDALPIARMIFDRGGVPTDFFSYIGVKIDYNDYNHPYMVKLYLLAASYVWDREETYLTMSKNLYEEMFSPEKCYTSLRREYHKLSLTPAVFRNIEQYDFSVEMLPQIIGKAHWVIHVFDKKSRIEVARYE